MCFFFHFQYGFRSSQSTADLLIVVSDRIARAFNRPGAIWIVAIDISIGFWRLSAISRLLTGFGMLFSFTNLSLMEFQVRYLALFILHKNIQLMLEFLKHPSLVQHFFYFTLMTILTILSAILISMLMILLSVLNVIRHLICGNNLNWLLNLNLIFETLWRLE